MRKKQKNIEIVIQIIMNGMIFCSDDGEPIEEAYQKGAEFGYNKGKSEAKELIKDFLLMAKVEHLQDRYETVDEAEQFLKEIEDEVKMGNDERNS